MAQKFTRRVDAWVEEADANFIEAVAAAEASTTSAVIRRMVRIFRNQAGEQPAQQAQG
jgi:hypothetical protein